MDMDKTEYNAIKETLSETQKLSKELNISLTEALLLRHLVGIR